jgi:hypothetical protein
VQHLGEERSGCNGEEGGGGRLLQKGGKEGADCCYEGRGGVARVFEKRRERSPDALDTKPTAHNQIPHPCPDLDK